MIYEDQIDILVDLSGHTDGFSRQLFLEKPAPIQVNYLGYPGTSGTTRMDYRITDQWADLQGSQRYYSEQLIRLPHGFLCYTPTNITDDIFNQSHVNKEKFTFCCFNDFRKLSDPLMNLWSEILQQAPESCLVLKNRYLADPLLRKKILSFFVEKNVNEKQINFISFLPIEEHLSSFKGIDLSLDTYPYNGTTTTCEACWMGVPTLTLVGSDHRSRVGYSLLKRLNLEEFIAFSKQEYVEKAVYFARHPELLLDIRNTLRKRMLNSTVCNPHLFVKELEDAYCSMWNNWCFSEG